MQDVNNTYQTSSLRSRERERESKRRAALVGVGVLLAIVAVLVSPLGSPIVSAVQNIFMGLNKVTDIQYGGKRVSKVIYRGQIIWERPPVLPEMPTGTDMQLIGTTYSCPTTRTRVVDARDNATYWVQKLADNRCWMLTNLAYAGGGINTYDDVKTITNGSTLDYTQPFYFIPPGANRTTGTTNPSISTNGTGQYGYLYNWCAAMGGQTTTSACMNATTPAPNQNISICPSGWRLPTGGTGGEYEALTTAIGATNNAAGSTALRSSWLGMYSGYWIDGFYLQGDTGYYWSSTQFTTATSVYNLNFTFSRIYPGTVNSNKYFGYAVRCLAL